MKTEIREGERSPLLGFEHLDGIGPAWKGGLPDSHDPGHDTVRHHCLWGTLLAGGGGLEWYFGYRFPHNDLNCDDFRSRENWWKQSALATRFVSAHPLEEMQNHDELISVEGAYCLARPGALYLVYLPIGWQSARLELGLPGLQDPGPQDPGRTRNAGRSGKGEPADAPEEDPDLVRAGDPAGPLEVAWFDPRKGGRLQEGSVRFVSGAGLHDLGVPPPSSGMDWVAVVGRSLYSK